MGSGVRIREDYTVYSLFGSKVSSVLQLTVYLRRGKKELKNQISDISYFFAWWCSQRRGRGINNGTDGRWQFCWEEVGTRIYIGNYIIYYIIIIYIIYILYI